LEIQSEPLPRNTQDWVLVPFGFHRGESESDVWETVDMKAPNAILIHKAPATIRCAACSQTFCISSYEGENAESKLEQMEAEYQRHLKEKHSREDSSQAALRVVRESTKDK
jgi:hypothetical protein